MDYQIVRQKFTLECAPSSAVERDISSGVAQPGVLIFKGNLRAQLACKSEWTGLHVVNEGIHAVYQDWILSYIDGVF